MIYRTFAASILAAVTMARGTGDGTSRANASELKLYDLGYQATTLYSYMKYNNGIDEHFIELKFESTQGRFITNLEFGFCYIYEEFEQQNDWWCTNVRTNLSNYNSSPEWGQTFDIREGYLKFSPGSWEEKF